MQTQREKVTTKNDASVKGGENVAGSAGVVKGDRMQGGGVQQRNATQMTSVGGNTVKNSGTGKSGSAGGNSAGKANLGGNNLAVQISKENEHAPLPSYTRQRLPSIPPPTPLNPSSLGYPSSQSPAQLTAPMVYKPGVTTSAKVDTSKTIMMFIHPDDIDKYRPISVEEDSNRYSMPDDLASIMLVPDDANGVKAIGNTKMTARATNIVPSASDTPADVAQREYVRRLMPRSDETDYKAWREVVDAAARMSRMICASIVPRRRGGEAGIVDVTWSVSIDVKPETNIQGKIAYAQKKIATEQAVNTPPPPPQHLLQPLLNPSSAIPASQPPVTPLPTALDRVKSPQPKEEHKPSIRDRLKNRWSNKAEPPPDMVDRIANLDKLGTQLIEDIQKAESTTKPPAVATLTETTSKAAQAVDLDKQSDSVLMSKKSLADTAADTRESMPRIAIQVNQAQVQTQTVHSCAPVRAEAQAIVTSTDAVVETAAKASSKDVKAQSVSSLVASLPKLASNVIPHKKQLKSKNGKEQTSSLWDASCGCQNCVEARTMALLECGTKGKGTITTPAAAISTKAIEPIRAEKVGASEPSTPHLAIWSPVSPLAESTTNVFSPVSKPEKAKKAATPTSVTKPATAVPTEQINHKQANASVASSTNATSQLDKPVAAGGENQKSAPVAVHPATSTSKATENVQPKVATAAAGANAGSTPSAGTRNSSIWPRTNVLEILTIDEMDVLIELYFQFYACK